MSIETLSEQLLRHEGIRLKPYRDTTGHLSIGIGRNLDDTGIFEDEALMMLTNDIARFRRQLSDIFLFNLLTINRQNVLVNMCFNLGYEGLMGFKKMWKAIEDYDFEKAADEMLKSKWAEQVGRRAKELAKIMRTGMV